MQICYVIISAVLQGLWLCTVCQKSYALKCLSFWWTTLINAHSHGVSGSLSYLIHGSLVPYQHESAAEWQLDWFSHLSRARGCDQQTDTSHMLECKCRLRNDLYCVGWGVKLYSNQTNASVWILCRLNKWALVPPWEEVDPEKKQKVGWMSDKILSAALLLTLFSLCFIGFLFVVSIVFA